MRQITQWITIVGVAVIVVAGARLRADSGNGGFTFIVGTNGDYPPDKTTQVETELYCNEGYTCGLTNIEVDWDDGSAIDSRDGYAPFEPDFDHPYDDNGLYHIDVSADDDMGNWADAPRNVTIG